MTTGEDEADAKNNAAASSPNATANAIPNELLDIFSTLAGNKHIVFKSQQIDDPELQLTEKQQIAQNIYNTNRECFLLRFGSYLNEQQLGVFETCGINEPAKPDESLDSVCLLLKDFKRKLHTRNVCVRNRRYAAMAQLLQQGEYFSDHEMMQREPQLYQELVGQYMTEDEKKQRDSYDVRNTSFSGILLNSLEQKQRDELLEQASSSNSMVQICEPAVDNEIPDTCRRQWGGFDEDEPVACSTSRDTTATVKSNAITTPVYYNAGERELQRNEFMSIMKERFLSGQDVDFDYTAVDENAQLDDLKQIERDAEDAYFEQSDDETLGPAKSAHTSDESEDELDVYMRHINRHHSLQS